MGNRSKAGGLRRGLLSNVVGLPVPSEWQQEVELAAHGNRKLRRIAKSKLRRHDRAVAKGWSK